MDFRRLLGTRPRRDDPPPRSPRPRLVLPQPLPILYVVGDVHGCHDLMLEAERAILADLHGTAEGKCVVYLGDLVDRGPRSADVLAHLVRPSADGLRRICLCGNHEQAMLDFLDDPERNRGWLEFGGEATLRSYGIPVQQLLREGGIRAVADAARLDVPAGHVAFMRGLPVSVSAGSILMVHAGIRPGVPLEEQTDEDLMWSREPFLSAGPGPGLMVIHGHTVSRQPSFAPGRLGIDTGAYIWGRLTVLRVHRGQCGFLA